MPSGVARAVLRPPSKRSATVAQPSAERRRPTRPPHRAEAPSLPVGVEAGLYKLYLPDRPSELAGYLSVRPDHAYEVKGPWGNRRWVRPRLVGDWYVDFWDFDTLRAWPGGSLSFGISDGFPFSRSGRRSVHDRDE